MKNSSWITMPEISMYIKVSFVTLKWPLDVSARVIWHKLFVLTVNAIHARAAEIRSYKLGITVGGINYFMSGEFLLVSDSKQTGCVAGF